MAMFFWNVPRKLGSALFFVSLKQPISLYSGKGENETIYDNSEKIKENYGKTFKVFI